VNKISLIIFLILLILISPIIYAQMCEVAHVRNNLREMLYDYFTSPSTAKIELGKIKDLLDFYLTIPSEEDSVLCDGIGANSNVAYYIIVNEADNLTTAGLPEPDLMIRTSGEFRISNFLLWQLAYSEIFISNVLWPEFRSKHLIEAVQDYQKRERRFGLVSEQLSSKSKKTNNAKTHSKKAV